MRLEKNAWEQNALSELQRANTSSGTNFLGGLKNVSALTQDQKDALRQVDSTVMITHPLIEKKKNAV